MKHSLRNIWIIFKREFASFFNSPVAYIVITVFLLITGWLFFQQFFLGGEASMRGLFSIMPLLLLFFAPAVSMRIVSEERKTGTLELLVTLPLRPVEIITGKFLASLGLLGVAILLTIPYAVTIGFLADMDWGPVIGGYVGLFLLGGGYLSLGTFSSAITKNQIISFILGLLFCFIVFIVDKVLFLVPGFMASTLEFISLDYHFGNVARGVIDTRDLLFYATFIGTFLMFSVYSLENERLK